MRRADVLTLVGLAVSLAITTAARAQDRTPAQTATGTLRLTIDPPSLVLIDNEQIGEVEKRSIELPVGPHRLRIVHADFQPLRRTIDVRASELIEMHIDLYDKGIPLNPARIPQRPAGARPAPKRTEPSPVPQADPIATVPQTSPVPVAQPTPEPPAPVVPPPALDAQLRIRIDPPAEVWVDGVRQGVYGEGTIAVSAGRHDVRIVHDDYQPLNRRLTVTRDTPAVLDLKLADRAVPRARPQP